MTDRAVVQRGRGVSSLVLVAIAAGFIGACSPAGSAIPSDAVSPAPSASAEASGGPTPVPTPFESGSSSATPATEPPQTDTDWGRIWDAIPASFPRPPGSQSGEPIGRGPSSAELSVGASPADVRDFYRDALPAAGYRPVAMEGPLEDDSWVFDTGVDAGCRTQVRVIPLSGVSHVTILFGADCPFR